MKIVNVIPFIRVMGKETLTYFTIKKVKVGSLVSVPVRSKNVPAIVVSLKDVSSSKLALKNATYGLRKITKMYEHGNLYLPSFIEAAMKAARYFATTPGAVLDVMTPRNIIEDYLSHSPTLPKKKPVLRSKKNPEKTINYEAFLFQENEKDRFTAYKSLIREHFVRGKSVFIMLPTIGEIERITPLLSRGIEEYVFVLHGGLSKKEQITTWGKALSHKHPVVIVGTGTFLSLPRADIGTLIVEKENTEGYKTMRRPFIDMRKFAEFYAQSCGINLILGDTFLRTETIYRREDEEFLPFAPLKFRSLSSAEQNLIDMKKATTSLGEGEFTLISNELLELIKNAQEKNESFFLLTGRRGLYPITICNDCGETVRCSTCETPLVLHGEEGVSKKKKTFPKHPRRSGHKNIFMCHTCGEQTKSRDLCGSCGGSRFATLGIGSERVFNEIENLFPSARVLRLDKETTARKGSAEKIIKEFYDSPNSILIGTRMAIPYLEHKVDNSAVVSIDSLFTIPDFRIPDRIFSLLLGLRNVTQKTFTIQTRLADAPLFKNIIQGNLLNFYRSEIEGRKRFNYPPFSTLIKLTRTGKKRLVEYDMGKLKTFLKDYNPTIFTPLNPGTKERTTLHALIRVDSKDWPNEALEHRLMKLPLSFTIKVDPETIL